MAEKNGLPVPAAAKRDAQSFEVIRIWIAEQDQHVALSFGMWEDPAAWGQLLADTARHIANAHAEKDRTVDTDAFVARLREGFDADFDGVEEEE